MVNVNFKDIQKDWEVADIYKSSINPRNKIYILDMFPYPSGAGLHVGHVEGYTGTDVLARYMRMKGNNVLHPMGWDAFGLPAENFAIKNKIPPAVSTAKNIETFTNQIKSIGLSYDWTREIDSSSPEYYKWTQWLFILLWKQGLVYKRKAPANWCPSCQTVLANEQVVEGKCERCDTPVVQKDLEQWFFEITKYADRLIEGLDRIDWPKSTKLMQKNWIGRKSGRKINFDGVEVFTTKPETIRGVSFLALAPEHPDVLKMTTENQRKEIDEYIQKATNTTNLERTIDKKKKTGVFTGSYVNNPVTGERVPVWVADYVLMTTGTGAVMGVPAGDERDLQFAKEFGLPVTSYEEYNEEVGSPFVTYHLRDWLVSRQRYWGAPIPMVYCDKDGWNPVDEKDLPVLLPTDVDFNPTGESPIANSESFQNGAICPVCGEKAKREVDTMDTFVDSSWYFLRFADPKNSSMAWSSEEADKWLPVDIYVGGAEHTVLHLMYSRFFYKVFYDLGMVPKEKGDEPFLKLRHPGTILGEDGRKMSKRWGNVINPDDVGAKFGPDTLRVYEMFMGPFDATKPWSTSGVEGVARFLKRLCSAFEVTLSEDESEVALARMVHQTIKKVEEDIEEMSFNTAISEFMKLLNKIQEVGSLNKVEWSMLVKILAPFAPFLAEELWSRLGMVGSVHLQKWPKYEDDMLKVDFVQIAVQVNGKFRAVMGMSFDDGQDKTVVLEKVLGDKRIAGYVGQEKYEVVFVPGRLINLVTK